MFYSEIIADFIINFKKAPNIVNNRAKELMLDTIGTALAGNKQECVLKSLKAFNGLSYAKNTKVWGISEKLDPIYASMLNGISSHALDFDDTHTEAILHASAILAPLCLTYGFNICNNGEKILKAFIIGWEIAARVGIASKGSFHNKGFHTTAIAGIFGAVCSASVLLDLNKEQIINAIGLTGSFASGINEFLSNGSNSKVIHIANAIKNAILIANLAKENISGPLSIFEGRDNIFRAYGIEEKCIKEELIKDLNQTWQIMQVSIKPFPSCHFTHGFIECALNLKNDGYTCDDIKTITCMIDEIPSTFVCDPIEKKLNPKTEYEAKFSLPFLMSLMFNDGFLNLSSFENLDRKEIISFAKKINYKHHKSQGFPKYFPGHIEVILNDNSILKKDIFINKGNFDNPLNKEEIISKFLSNASKSINKEYALHIIDQINNIENISNLII